MNWNSQKQSIKNSISNVRISGLIFLFVVVAGVFDSAFGLNTTCPLSGNVTPFKPSTSMGRCFKFQNSACCSTSDLQKLEQQISDDQIDSTYSSSPQCLSMFNDLYCATSCSPYQSEFIRKNNMNSNGTNINSNNGTSHTFEFYMDRNFCEDLFKACENVQLQGGMTVKDLFVNAVPFCQATSPLDYYVNVTTNDAQSFNGKDKPADPTKSFISSGPSLVSIGRDAVYVIQSADASGNLIYNSSSNNAFSISVSGPSSVIQVQSRAITPLTLTNNGDGTYSAIFTTLVTGDYSINARLNGQDISNSPRVTSFIAGSASALSYLSCPAPRCADGLFIPDEQIELTIVTLDALGNAITVGEDQFTVLVAGPETVYASVYDNADGTYLVSFSATQIGTYRIQAFLENTISIGNCSVTLAAGAVSPNTTIVYETETLHACDEENPSILTIQGYDTRGNKILTGGASFQVNVTGPSDDAQVNVVDHYDGSYRVQYSVKIAGTYNIHVSFHGIELNGSPIVAFLEAGELSVNTTSTYGEGLDSTQEVGESQNITIVPSDACNNNITDEDIQFNVIITKLSSGQQLKSISSFASVPSSSFSKVEYNNGLYEVTYKLKQTGIYSIDIQQGGVSLSSFPIQVEAINSGSSTGPACLGCVEVIGSASSVASSAIGVTNELLIETENCKGNLQNTDGEFNVFFSYDGTPFSNSSFSTSIENVGNGRYALSYTAQISGEADLFVQVKKSGVFTDVTGSPFQINFINGATCLNDCSGYGACVAGVCQCAEFHSGADCSLFDTPKITAVFTEGANILVTFSLPTNRAEMEYVGDCDNIFSSANVAMFGNLNENECTWLSDSEVLIRLGYDATISLGDSLEINNPKLKTLSSIPTTIEDTVLIEGPYFPESPYVQIIAPSIINTCQEEVVVDARSSLGNLNRPFMGISWNLVAIDGLDSSSQQFIDFADYLSYQNTLLLTLNPQTMQTGVTYTIELVVHNYLNGEGRGYANIYVTDVHSPVVTIQAPSTLKIREDQGITIRAEVSTPCGNGDLSFAWTRSHFIDTPEQPLPISGTAFKDLYIPPYTFSADTTFVLQLIASVNHNIYGLGKDTVIVQVEKASPYQISYENVMINTQTPSLHAQKRTLSRRSSLVLDASTFLYKSAKEADYEIRWACSQIEPVAECKSCLDKESYDYYLKGKTRVAFPPSTFHPGVYKFVASIYDIGGSYHSDNALGVPEVEVEFVSSGVPEVFIKPVPIKSLNYGQKITFQGQIIGGDSFTWSLFAGEEEISLEDEPDVKQGYNGDVVLIFNPKFLKAGVTYTVSLIATNSEGSGKSEMTFTVNAPPQGGKLEISPSSGNAFSTKFALLANNFGDAEMNYPFTYEYYFVNSNGKELPLSIGIDLDNSVEVTLPHNAESVVVYVSDSLGAYTRSVVDVEVLFVKSSNKKRDQHGDDILYSAERLATVDLNEAIASGDMESATHVIFSILALLNDPAGTGYNTNENTRVSIRSKIIDLIQSSAFGVSDSTSGRVILGQIITGLAECPNELTTNYAYRLSNSLVSLTTAFSTDGISGYSGYKESFSPSILNTVSNLLSKTQPANKQAQFSSNGLKSLQLLAFALLEDDTVYDDPIEITGDDIYLQTDREMVSNLQLSFSSSEHHLSMVLSDEVADSLSTQGITSVDTLFVASRANIYSYASTLVESSLASYQVAKTGTLSFDNIKLAGNVDDLIEVTIPFNRNWPYQVCQSWDSSSSSWSAGSCSLVSTDRTAGTVTCSCDGKSLESISGIYATEVGYAPLILDGKGPVGSLIAQMTLAPDVNVGRSTLWWLVLVIVGVAVVTIATLLVYRHHQAKKRQLEVESIEAEPIPQVVVPINANANVKYEEPEEVVEVVNRIKLYGGKSDSDETQSLRVYPIKKYSSSSDGSSDDSTGVVEKPRRASIKNENDESEDEAIGRTKKAKEESSSSDSENKKKSSSEEEGSLLKRKGGKLLESSSSSSSSDQEEVKRSNKSKIIEESSGSSSDTSSEEEEIKRGNTSSRLRED